MKIEVDLNDELLRSHPEGEELIAKINAAGSFKALLVVVDYGKMVMQLLAMPDNDESALSLVTLAELGHSFDQGVLGMIIKSAANNAEVAQQARQN